MSSGVRNDKCRTATVCVTRAEPVLPRWFSRFRRIILQAIPEVNFVDQSVNDGDNRGRFRLFRPRPLDCSAAQYGTHLDQ